MLNHVDQLLNDWDRAFDFARHRFLAQYVNVDGEPRVPHSPRKKDKWDGVDVLIALGFWPADPIEVDEPPAPMPSYTAAEERAYQAIIMPALDRWWQTYGRSWTATNALVLRGWDKDDIKQEVIVSALSKSKGKSRWDPSRSNVDAWAGIVGRSRVLHLLDRDDNERVTQFDVLGDNDGLRDLTEDDLPWSGLPILPAIVKPPPAYDSSLRTKPAAVVRRQR